MRILCNIRAVAAIALFAGCSGSTDITVENLEGTWDATTHVFTNTANTSESVDIIAINGASLVLTVEADGTTTSVFDDGMGNSSSDSGQFTAEGSTFTLAGETFGASLSGDQLILTDDTAAFDFDDDGSDDPATLRITLNRR